MNLPLSTNSRYLLAFSGGPDSLAVFHALLEGGYQFDCIHINHGLSDNADKWQANCVAICKKHGVELMCFKVEVDKNASSVEQDARNKRYGVISRIFSDYGCWKAVLTGHHRDDNIETILFNLFRGGEISVLDGIKMTDTIFGFDIIRPVLSFTRGELTAYLASIGDTNWNEDESNYDVSYSRNFLRHDIIPRLRRHFNAFDTAVTDFAMKTLQAQQFKTRWLEDHFIDNQLDFRSLLDYYTTDDPVLRDLVISLIYHGLTTRSKKFPSRGQLLQLCQELFIFKSGKTPNEKTFRIGEVVCERRYNNSDSKELVIVFHEVNANTTTS